MVGIVLSEFLEGVETSVGGWSEGFARKSVDALGFTAVLCTCCLGSVEGVDLLDQVSSVESLPDMQKVRRRLCFLYLFHNPARAVSSIRSLSFPYRRSAPALPDVPCSKNSFHLSFQK